MTQISRYMRGQDSLAKNNTDKIIAKGFATAAGEGEQI
jgi:hypothetical protein